MTRDAGRLASLDAFGGFAVAIASGAVLLAYTVPMVFVSVPSPDGRLAAGALLWAIGPMALFVSLAWAMWRRRWFITA